MRFISMLLISSTLLVTINCSNNVRADETDLTNTLPKIKFSGFGTLGYNHMNNDDLYFVRDISQTASKSTTNGFAADSRLGLQANVNLWTDWEAVVQVVDRYKAKPTLGNSIEWAFISYRPSDDTVIRVGRLGTDIFALSDLRNVGYAYTWVRPPTEFYGWIPIYSIDGIDIATNFHVGDATIRPKLVVGKSRVTVPSNGMDFDYHANNIYGFSVTAELNEWRARVSHVRARINAETPLTGFIEGLQQLAPIWPQAPLLAQEITIDGSIFNYNGVALSYDNGGWQIQSELSKSNSNTSIEPGGYVGYVSVGRRFDNWLPYVVYSKSIETIHGNAVAPPNSGLQPIADVVNAIINTNRIRQTTWAAGVRWDFNPRMALKMQLSDTQIKGDGASLWHINSPTWSGGSQIQFSTSFDFIF